MRESLKAGPRGYLLKDSEDFDLLKAVKTLVRGRLVLRAYPTRRHTMSAAANWTRAR